MAVNISIALMAFGVRTDVGPSSRRLVSIMLATMPEVTPAAMLVPLSLM